MPTAIPLCRTGLGRHSAFGYSCSRCLSCCRHKTIQLNPYEIARLAGSLGISTTGFIDRFTTVGGTALRSKEDGTCVFLDARGCSVHADRPLVCRLYPLVRHVGLPGAERFSQVEPEEGCRGIFHGNGDVERYLEEQGAFPFMEAADRYLELLRHLLESLMEPVPGTPGSEAVLDAVRAVSDGRSDGFDLSWMDMDRALARYREKNGVPLPVDAQTRMRMHIEAVRSWAAQHHEGDAHGFPR